MKDLAKVIIIIQTLYSISTTLMEASQVIGKAMEIGQVISSFTN